MPSSPRRGPRAARTLFLCSLVLGLAACGKDEQGRGPGGGPPAVVTTTVLAPAP